MKGRISSAIAYVFSVIAVCCCLTSLAFSQDITGSIFGTVKDNSGAVVAGATVSIADSQKSNLVVRTITTNENGEFSAPNLPVGVYAITIEAQNFKKSVQTAVKLDVGQRRTVDFALEAGNISEVVTIEADPLSVDLQTPQSRTLITGDQVRELSINNRNFVQLVTLAPGVSNDLSDQVYVGNVNPTGQANTVNIAVNGARSAQNTFTVDGADITDRGSNITIQAFPSVDSIGEFVVNRALFPAESGSSGGGQVNVVTRSGTDAFHGSLFEFVRNDKLNANDYLNNQTAPNGRTSDGKAKRAPFRYNNFGFTIGGPVYFVNVKKDSSDGFIKRLSRTFFFFSEEQRRDIRYPSFTSSVPTSQIKQGIFPIDICLSATSATTCSNILRAGTPLTSINPIAQQYITNIYSKLPEPNLPNYQLVSTFKNQAKFRQEILKIDHSFSDKWSAYYRFENDKIPTIDANSLFSNGTGLPGVATTQTNSPGRTHTVQTTYAVTPKLIIEGRYNYAYGAILSNNIGLLALANSPITVPLPYANTRDRVPTITGNGFSNLTGYGPYDNFSNKHLVAGSVSAVIGSHTMKFGANFSKYRKNENAIAGNNEGAFSGFNNTTAASATQGSVLAPGVTNTAVNTNLQAFANFLLGNNVTFSQASFDYTADLRQRNFESYGQDEWRVRNNLTLYYGLRYSFFGSPWDKNGRLTNFVPELYSASSAPAVTGAGNRVAGTGNFCNGLIVNTQNSQTAANCNPIASPYGKYIMDAPKLNLAPRVGLAWDPFGKGTTSIRTGYGIYHDQVLNGTLLQQIGLNPPYQQNVTVANTSLSQPIPAGQSPTVVASATAPNLRAVQADFKTPYMQHWSFDVQHQLSSKTVIDIGYYGSKGTNLIGAVELNELKTGVATSSQCATGSNYFGQGGVVPTQTCLAPGTAFQSSAATNIIDQLRPYKGYRSITIIQPRFNSNYHSLQASLQQRFTAESQLQVSYTFSKNLTDNQTDRSTAPQNTYDIASDYGRATLDRRHIFTANLVYEVPFFRERKDLVGKALGGWQASSIVTYQTGLPFTPATSSYDPAGVGFIPAAIAGGRPNILCDPNENAPNTQQQWFNTSCFQRNPATGATGLNNSLGTAQRGAIFGPRTFRTDFTLVKNIRFGENMRLQLRGEAFNIFNTVNARTIGTNVTLATYGTVTAFRDPRTIQLGIKFYF